MAASLARSSARVWPRSVIRVADTSEMTVATSSAVDSTAPVHVMSPTVRYRTTASNSCSSSPRVTCGLSASRIPSRSKTWRVWAKYTEGSSSSSRSMYCQMSSSVQLDSGKTRMCSPRWIRVLYRFHSSGR